MSFRLFTSNRLDILLENYLRVSSACLPSDPFVPETIVVQSQGMGTWLREQLARHRGNATHLDFPFVSTVADTVLAAVAPANASGPGAYSIEDARWRIFQRLRENPPELQFLQHFSSPDDDPAIREVKQYQLADKIARVFDQYQIYRPDMILAWETGENPSDDPTTAWQAFLWRDLHRATRSRTARLKEFFTSDKPWECPYESLAVFGISTLPPMYLEFFIRLGERIDVNFFYVNPCRGYWLDQLTEKEAFRLNENFADFDQQFCETSHPLLASLGRQGREFFSAILDSGAVNAEELDGFADIADPAAPDGASLLAVVQQDVLDMVRRAPGDKLKPAFPDPSIQLHSCHSRMREIEVLHDNLLAIIETSDSRIQPRDILVMAPDIGEYAPYIDAVFGQNRFRDMYTIADRNLLSESKLAVAFYELFKILVSDFKVNDVAGLLAEESVHLAFGIVREDLETINRWLNEAGVRWGIDQAQRRRRGKYPFPDYSWRYGLKRMLLGMAMLDETGEPVGDCLPYDKIEGTQAVLLGRLIDFVENLIAFSETVNQSLTLSAWSGKLLEMLDTFFHSDNDTFADIANLRAMVMGLEKHATRTGFDGPVSLGVVREYLQEAGEASFGPQQFLKGRLTFCTLQPMRSIPSRVICLIGMNDGEFPRPDKRLGFDIIAQALRPCDRTRRFEDRYLFLEALLAARQVFYISYLGQSVKDNSLLPPATPVCELLDALEGTVAVAGGIRSALETRHCLQAFNPRYFQGGGSGLKSYSVNAFLGARKMQAGKIRRNFVREGLPPPDLPDTLDVEDLERFFANPCACFVRVSLGAQVQLQEADELQDSEPFGLDSLESYSVNQQVVEGLLAGRAPATIYARLKHDQTIEPGTPGRVKTLALCEEIEKEFVGKFGLQDLVARQQPQPVQVECGPVTLSGILELGDGRHVCHRYADTKGKDVIRAWLRHLLANAAGRPVTTFLVMKDTREADLFKPLDREAARTELELLLNLYHEGLAAPLPFFSNSAYRFAISGKDKLQAAQKAFATTRYSFGEDQDPGIRLCFPDGEQVLASDRFEALARQVFKGVYTDA